MSNAWCCLSLSFLHSTKKNTHKNEWWSLNIRNIQKGDEGWRFQILRFFHSGSLSASSSSDSSSANKGFGWVLRKETTRGLDMRRQYVHIWQSVFLLLAKLRGRKTKQVGALINDDNSETDWGRAVKNCSKLLLLPACQGFREFEWGPWRKRLRMKGWRNRAGENKTGKKKKPRKNTGMIESGRVIASERD